MPATPEPERGRLLISCPDTPGIVAAVSQFLFQRGANIVHSDQHSTAPVGGVFFMRIVFDLDGLAGRMDDLQAGFRPLAHRFDMQWHLAQARSRKRIAVFVSREAHCLLELLWQHEAGDLRGDIALVVSNHPDLRSTVEGWNIPFVHIPIEPGGKVQAEERQLEAVGNRIDLIVLARYMQILSGSFLARWNGPIINIHHSFLPAFVGAKPYDQAYNRGVKLIGATAHYVTEDLDEGPIIEQDIARVDHRHTVSDLKRLGRAIERVVLARAVSWHVDDRVLVHEGKTVVFS